MKVNFIDLSINTTDCSLPDKHSISMNIAGICTLYTLVQNCMNLVSLWFQKSKIFLEQNNHILFINKTQRVEKIAIRIVAENIKYQLDFTEWTDGSKII